MSLMEKIVCLEVLRAGFNLTAHPINLGRLIKQPLLNLLVLPPSVLQNRTDKMHYICFPKFLNKVEKDNGAIKVILL